MPAQPEMRKLTAEQLDEQVESIVRFLQLVHPGLTRDSDFRPCVELRPIPRIPKDTLNELADNGKKKELYKLSRSLNLWELTDVSILRLRRWLYAFNGQPCCLYYSVFSYDNNKKFPNKDGVLTAPNRIRSESAEEAEEVALDFDDIGFREYKKLVLDFEQIGIHALWVFTGHGYQAHILLEEPLSDKRLLRHFVYKFRSKGFNADATCVDPARVMRLPGTFNCKCFTDEHYAREIYNPPKCEVVQGTTERYSLDYLIQALDSLPTVSEVDERAFENAHKSSEPAPVATKHTGKTAAPVRTSDLKPVSSASLPEQFKVRKLEYPYINQFDLPDAVEQMLIHVKHGLRNKALGFLIKFLKTQYRLGKDQLLEVLTIWAKYACDPPYNETEFMEDFNRLFYKYEGLGYDPALIKEYGTIDFSEYIRLRKEDIHIPNGFMRDLDKMDATEVRAYLAIRLLEHDEIDATQEKIAEILGISVRSLQVTLKALTARRHCYVKVGSKRGGIPNTYHSDKFVRKDEGFMPLGYNDARAYVNELCENGPRTRATAELKLYLFMRWKFYSGQIFMSQENLALNIGVARTAVTAMVRRMEEKHYIKITKTPVNAALDFCEYILLR